jgi:membrane protein
VASDRRLPPISGQRLDPLPHPLTDSVAKIMERNQLARLAYRTFIRFSYAKATLLAAGTTYYVFLSVFALTALGYGLAAYLGSDELSQAISQGLVEAFPGVVGSDGSNSEAIRAAGQVTSIVGFVVLLYSGSAAMYAASRSLHNIYGAPKDPRNYVLARLRLLAWLLLIAPLALISYLVSGAVVVFGTDLFTELGITGPVSKGLITAVGLIVALILDFIVIYLLLSRFGGILPKRSARVIGAMLGAAAIEVLKYVMAIIVAWSLSKPEYGAFATTITALLIIFLQCITLFLCAALTGALSEDSAPISAMDPAEAEFVDREVDGEDRLDEGQAESPAATGGEPVSGAGTAR